MKSVAVKGPDANVPPVKVTVTAASPDPVRNEGDVTSAIIGTMYVAKSGGKVVTIPELLGGFFIIKSKPVTVAVDVNFRAKTFGSAALLEIKNAYFNPVVSCAGVANSTLTVALEGFAGSELKLTAALARAAPEGKPETVANTSAVRDVGGTGELTF